MKVLLFSTQWPEYMVELANAMSRHCATILVLPHNHRLTDLHRRQIDKKVKLETFKVVFHKSIRDNAAMLFGILRIIWKHKPNVLHIQSNGHRLFCWIYFFLPWGTKIVNTIHDPVKHLGDDVSNAIGDSSAVFCGKLFTSKYIVHGDFLRKQLAEAYHVKERRIAVIPHGNFEIYKKFQLRQVTETDHSVLFFGRIWKYKGLDIFIEAANILVQVFPAVKILIVGKGEDFSPYRALIRSPENFEIVNERIPLEEVGMYFQRSAVVVLPYLEATQSGIIPLAFGYGKPVVTTNVGSLSEVVIDGTTGFVVPPRSPVMLVEKILYLLTDHEVRRAMGSAALAYARNELSWNSIAARTFQVYSNLSA